MWERNGHQEFWHNLFVRYRQAEGITVICASKVISALIIFAVFDVSFRRYIFYTVLLFHYRDIIQISTAGIPKTFKQALRLGLDLVT